MPSSICLWMVLLRSAASSVQWMLAGYLKWCAFRLVGRNTKKRGAAPIPVQTHLLAIGNAVTQVKHCSQRLRPSDYCCQQDCMARESVHATNMLLKCMYMYRKEPYYCYKCNSSLGKRGCDLLIKDRFPCVCWKEAVLLHFLLYDCFSAALKFSSDSFTGVYIGLQDWFLKSLSDSEHIYTYCITLSLCVHSEQF